jgi:hypothetical protein
MADDTQAGTPAAATPAAASAATPAAASTPAAAAAPATPAARAKAPVGGGKQGNVPPGAFMERVRRDAVKLVATQLNCTIEEAKAVIAKGGKLVVEGSQDQAAAATANQALETVQRENKRLQNQIKAVTDRATGAEKKLARERQRRQDSAIEFEIRSAASSAGIIDPDYGMSLFARAAAGGKTTDPVTFFAGLKGTHAYLFQGAAAAAAPVPGAAAAAAAPPAVVVPASTAPPESAAPGGAKPAPAPAGGPKVDVGGMSGPDFAAHTQSRYGYRPGAS